MNQSRQQTAFQLWQALPHAMIWLAFIIMCMLLGYGTMFLGILPALPLMVTLVLAWESPPRSTYVSLGISGLCFDLFAGTPIGMTAFLWLSVAWWHHKNLTSADEDSPFSTRWFTIAHRLILYLILEAAVSWWLNLTVAALTFSIMRWLGMLFLIPIIAYFNQTARQRTYRKLWMFLPPEIKPV